MNLIVAISQDGVIGDGDKIPWHNKRDFAHFKETTMGHVLVMGRKTFESIGKPLSGRVTWVLTRDPYKYERINKFPDIVHYVNDIKEVHHKIGGEVFICGGEQIYNKYVDFCNVCYVSIIKKQVKGDKYFKHFGRMMLDEVLHEDDDVYIGKYSNRMYTSLKHI